MDFLLGALYSWSSSLSLHDQINSVPRNQIISLCRCYEYRNPHTLSDCLLFASSPLEMGEGQVQSTLLYIIAWYTCAHQIQAGGKNNPLLKSRH